MGAGFHSRSPIKKESEEQKMRLVEIPGYILRTREYVKLTRWSTDYPLKIQVFCEDGVIYEFGPRAYRKWLRILDDLYR